MSKYAQLATNAFNKIQMNAGILCTSFDPSTGVASGILGVTSGGLGFNAAYTYKDFGEDMDNVPKNTKELKRIESVDVKCSGTFATIDGVSAAYLIGAYDDSESEIGATEAHIIPSSTLDASAFQTLWLVGDYSSDISSGTGGYCAIKMLNAASTGGFQMQTTDKDKGKFAFEFTAHYGYNSPDTVPYELYLKQGTQAESIVLRVEPSQTVSNAVKVTAIGYGLKSTESWKIKYGAATTTDPTIGGTATGFAAMNSNPIDGVAAAVGNKIIVAAVTTSTNKVVVFGTAIVEQTSGIIANVEPTPTEGD